MLAWQQSAQLTADDVIPTHTPDTKKEREGKFNSVYFVRRVRAIAEKWLSRTDPQIGHSRARSLISAHAIKTREYYGNTSMESEMGFLMASQTLVCPLPSFNLIARLRWPRLISRPRRERSYTTRSSAPARSCTPARNSERTSWARTSTAGRCGARVSYHIVHNCDEADAKNGERASCRVSCAPRRSMGYRTSCWGV